MTSLRGFCDTRFERVRAALQRNLESGDELGASLAVDADGYRAVDLWGGHRDEAGLVAWDEHTITEARSTSGPCTTR